MKGYQMQFAQIRDRVITKSESAETDLSKMVGVWVNSNPETTGVARMVITQAGPRLSLRIYAIGPEGLVDWGSVDADVFTATPSSHGAVGFTCVYDFGFVETILQVMLVKGLIVLSQIHRFKDGSNRADYFVREFLAYEPDWRMTQAPGFKPGGQKESDRHMTQTLEFKLSGHLNPALLDSASKTLHADKLIGRWLNTNPETQGVAEIIIEDAGERFFVSAQGVGENGLIAWPRTEATALANLEDEGGQLAMAPAVDFDFGFMRAETHLRVNKGVLVMVTYYIFLDGSRRSNYVNKEFFYRHA
ncbi:MAG TPA: hypothetical protein VFY40_10700 [Blastocatellia bacterium]|nr:hypothetical protein [Blastocatellia bacterium]